MIRSAAEARTPSLALAILLSVAAGVWAHGSAPPQARVLRTKPGELEPGTKVEIPEAERVVLELTVVDADTKKPIPCRVHIRDGEGNYYPPEGGHRGLAGPWYYTTYIDHEPDVVNEGKTWAMLEAGTCTVHLRARDGYTLQVERGLEYSRPVVRLDLANQLGQTVRRTVEMKRGINMKKLGWMSADSHVHNLTPAGAVRQMPVEMIDYVNLMFIGPEHPLWRRGDLTGAAHKVSTKDYIVSVSQEIRDANQGHMTLLGIKEPVSPIRAYTGREINPNTPVLPNEPLNWDVYDYVHKQNGLAFHAHYLFWPGYSSAISAALAKLDGVEWLQTDIVHRGARTRQDIQVKGFPLTGGGQMWYYMLNCGAHIPLLGGTDKMGAWRALGCSCRTYAKVDDWSHDGFMNALRAGATFVTNGPLLNLTADGRPIGSELTFSGEGPHEVTVQTGCYTERPIAYFEIIQDGKVAHRIDVGRGQKTVQLTHKLAFSRSGWLAVRCGTPKHDRDNWHNGITAAHSSPIYVTVNGTPPADADSARYMIARVAATVEWAETVARWSSPEAKAHALDGMQKAKAFYTAALQRATGSGM